MRRLGLALAALAAVVAVAAALWPRGRPDPDAAQPARQPAAAVEAQPALQVPAHEPEPEREAPEALASPAAATEELQQPSLADDPVRQLAWGYVLDERGEPLTGAAWARVQLVDPLGETRKTQVGADGTWSLAGLAPGTWHASATASGMRAEHALLELAPAAEPLRHDFRMERQPELRVKLLTRDGRPFLAAARDAKLPPMSLVPVATLEPPGATFHGVRGSLNNPFGVGQMWLNGQADVRLPEEFYGVVRLDVPPPVHLSLVLYHDVLQTQRVGPRQDEVTFRIDPDEVAARLGALRLRLVDAPGEAVARPQAMLQGPAAMMSGKPPAEDGTLLFERLPPGRYELTVRAPGFASVLLDVDVPPGEVRDLGELVLREPTPIRGRVVDAAGEPFAAAVGAGPLPEPGEAPRRGIETLTATDGTFELDGVGPGLWLLQVSSRRSGLSYLDVTHLAPNVVVDTRRGPVEGLVVQVEPVSYAVVSWAGDGEGLRLRFLDERGLVRQHGSLWQRAPFRYPLPPGHWRVVVEDTSGEVVDERTFDLGAEPVRVELGPR